MRKVKWVGLILTSGALLQLGTCVTDLAYYVLQAAATQIINGALAGATT